MPSKTTKKKTPINKNKTDTNKEVTNKKITRKVTITRKSKKIETPKQLQTTILSTGTVSEVDIDAPSKFDHYIVPINTDMVRPKLWELPNRKRFYDWVLATFSKYETGNLAKEAQSEQKPSKKTTANMEKIHLNNIQRLTRDFMQGESPNRGLLFYIGLGVGKTCAAVAVSEAIQTKKQVIILSKASLEDNFRKEILQCGAEYMKTHHHWEFKTCNRADELKFAIEVLGIPQKSITQNGGAFFIDFSKSDEPNYGELSTEMREKLRIQINHLIDSRFSFLHTDNTRLIGTLGDDVFDEKVVIVDEVHNLGNMMVSESSKAGPRFYELFMKAKNPKFIFLSGTPLINQVYESTRIFNVLRGYMPTLIVKFKTTFDVTINYDNLRYQLLKNKFIDQIIENRQNKIVKISKLPDYFINSNDGKGIVYSAKPEDTISIEDFAKLVTKLIESQGYKFSIETKMETALPEIKKDFEQQFYNPELNKLKRIDLIKRRIAGLTSYYEYQDKTKYPTLLAVNKVRIPMSTYQFGVYERFRHQELEKERFKKRSAAKEDDSASSSNYRLASRFACTFVFPEEIGNPYDNEQDEKNIEYIEMLADKDSQFDLSVSDLEEMKAKDIEKKIKTGYLNLLYKDRAQYLDINNGSLAKHSPKYLEMINNIRKSLGKILVYSYFKFLIGLNTFSYALMQTGEWAEFKIRKVNKKWELDEDEADKDKRKFLFYTGDEDREIREIYRNVYNSLWDRLPASCEKLVAQLKEKSDSNHYGEVVQMLMTTKTGAEGLDLKEVRQIHIMEPYWQPVLIDQVIGRGVRNESHMKLPVADRNVEVFIYMATITPLQVSKISYPDVRLDTYKYPNPALEDKKNKVVTSDEYLYILAERKKLIINEFQKLMKESAFDCALNYHDNRLNPANSGLVCLDYANKTRNAMSDYLYTPDIEDTVESIELAQEKVVSTPYRTFAYKGVTYYHQVEPNLEGKMYIYDQSIVGRVRLPKPVGEIKIINGEAKKVFYKKKK